MSGPCCTSWSRRGAKSPRVVGPTKVAASLPCDSQLISVCHRPGHGWGSRGCGGGTGKCMFPRIQALGTLFFFFSFWHFCVYSAFISEKLQPASGNCLSPLGVLVIGLPPTDWSVTVIPASSVMRPTRVIVCAPRISGHPVCDHARCRLSLRFRETRTVLSPPADSHHRHLRSWLPFRGKAARCYFLPLKTHLLFQATSN